MMGVWGEAVEKIQGLVNERHSGFKLKKNFFGIKCENEQ